VEVDRKILADLAVRDPQAFSALVQISVAALGDDAAYTGEEDNVDEAAS
jgi:hypothetical protein